MNYRTSILSLLIVVAILISACIKVEDPVLPITGTATFSAKIDGDDFSVSGILVSAEYVDQTQYIQSLGIAGAKPPLSGVSQAIALAIVSADSTGIKAGDTYISTSTAKVGAAEYTYDDGTADIKALSSNTNMASITITEINYDTKVVSGTFSFDGADDDDPATIYKITEGVFNDVPFD